MAQLTELIDPRTQEVRYLDLGDRPHARAVQAWLDELEELGLQPERRVILNAPQKLLRYARRVLASNYADLIHVPCGRDCGGPDRRPVRAIFPDGRVLTWPSRKACAESLDCSVRTVYYLLSGKNGRRGWEGVRWVG